MKSIEITIGWKTPRGFIASAWLVASMLYYRDAGYFVIRKVKRQHYYKGQPQYWEIIPT